MNRSIVRTAKLAMFQGQTGQDLLKLTQEDPAVRLAAREVLRMAMGWDKLPNGWTQESAKKFWASLTGEAKHKVTTCIRKMQGNLDDSGAFCASLADMVEGSTSWRSKKATGMRMLRPEEIKAAAAQSTDYNSKGLRTVVDQYGNLVEKIQDLLQDFTDVARDADREWEKITEVTSLMDLQSDNLGYDVKEEEKLRHLQDVTENIISSCRGPKSHPTLLSKVLDDMLQHARSWKRVI